MRCICWFAVLLGIAGCSSAAPPTPTSLRVPGLRQVWMFEAAERGAVISTPLVHGDRIYISAIRDVGRGTVFCLDATTKKELWRFDSNGTMLHMYSSPRIAEGRLFVGEGMHENFICKLYCLDAGTGRFLWHFQAAGHIESTPAVVQDRVYFAAGDDGIYCLNTTDGKLHWHFAGPFHIDSSPIVVGGRVYAGCGISRRFRQTEVICLQASDAKVIWRTPTDLPVWSTPTVDRGEIFVGLGNGRLLKAPDDEPGAGALLCLDTHSGKPKWRFPTGDALFAAPSVTETSVIFGARDGICYSLDRANGQERWKTDTGSPILTKPALADEHVYVLPSGGRLLALKTDTGEILWSHDLGQPTQTRPRMLSSPVLVRPPAGRPARLYFGGELYSAFQSAAVVYCFEELSREAVRR